MQITIKKLVQGRREKYITIYVQAHLLLQLQDFLTKYYSRYEYALITSLLSL